MQADGPFIGSHIINSIAGDIIGEACLGIEYGASAEDLARVCMAHPTVSEVVKGAAQKVAFGNQWLMVACRLLLSRQCGMYAC